MTLDACFSSHGSILMEGALGERLKREYHLTLDKHIAMAGLLYAEAGRAALRSLWTQYMDIAKRHGLPFLATTPTRRANRERLALAGLEGTVISDNVRFLRGILETGGTEMYVGGLMGCRDDAYTGEGALTMADARDFHVWQADLFMRAGVDFLYADIMPTLPEAAGMARALASTGLPYIISFTIQRDGRLIDGTSIRDAIGFIDGAAVPRPLCYMANCVHPDIVYQALLMPFNQTSLVRERFRGIQANTSPLSFAELDGVAELHSSKPEAFAAGMLRLKEDMGLKILGGCCGTDSSHMEAVARGMQSMG